LKTFHLLYHLARADFLERVRRYSFLITVAAAVYLGYAVNAGYVTLNLDKYRGVYNSAWVGILMTLSTTFLVSVVGFYIVKNAIDRDRQTRVGQILAATPLSRMQYGLGKWLSNFAVLAVIVLILAAAGVLMQFLRGEETHLEWWPLLAPFLLIALPAMAVVAALAVAFECIRWLSGGFGNVFYFFLWAFLLIYPVESKNRNLDLFGIGFVEKDLRADAKARFPDYNGNFSLNAGPRTERAHVTFLWNGINWTTQKVSLRFLWYFAAVLLVFLATLFFDRFDTKTERPPCAAANQMTAAPDASLSGPQPAAVHLTPLAGGKGYGFTFAAILAAELKLMFKGLHWWWLAVAGGLVLAGLLAPAKVVREFILPVSWLWPVLLWSPMGTREARHQTNQLFFSAPYPLRRQLPAIWMAGVLVAALTGAGAGLRFSFSGEWGSVFAWVSGAAFIPSLALALGTWSGTSKLFEAVYTAIWYIGPINKIPALDYAGAASQSIASGMPAVFLLVSLILLGVAVIGRKRQLQV
jgi:ABC-type multidrug transport system permease subunit